MEERRGDDQSGNPLRRGNIVTGVTRRIPDLYFSNKRKTREDQRSYHVITYGGQGEGEKTKGGPLKRARTLDVRDAEPTETIGGLPNEIAHNIMSFMGLKDLFNIGRTSTAHRSILLSLLERTSDSPIEMNLLVEDYEYNSFIMDRSTIMSVLPNGNVRITSLEEQEENGREEEGHRMVEAEGHPISYDIGFVMALAPRMVAGREIYKVEKGSISVKDHSTSVTRFQKELLFHKLGIVFEEPIKHMHHSLHGTLYMISEVDKQSVIRQLKSKEDSSDKRSLMDLISREEGHIFTRVLFTYKGFVCIDIIPRRVTYMKILDHETMIVESEETRIDTIMTIELYEMGRGLWIDPIWSMKSKSNMHIQSSCMISTNRLILFTVSFPWEDRNKVFLIERGPTFVKGFHLSYNEKSDSKIIKISYERGVVIMFLGNDSSGINKIVAMDMIRGEVRDWEFKAPYNRSYATESEGLQFVFDRRYAKIVLS